MLLDQTEYQMRHLRNQMIANVKITKLVNLKDRQN